MGRIIETITIVIDFEKLSFQRHYYWPAIEMLKQVRSMHCVAMYMCLLLCRFWEH